MAAKEGHHQMSQAGEHAVGVVGVEHDPEVAGGLRVLNGHQLPHHGPGKWPW